MAGGGPAGLKGLAVADHGRGLDGRGLIGHALRGDAALEPGQGLAVGALGAWREALNLTDAVIREQGELPQAQRRGALVVVDEMQSMPGVDYESMLSELGKYGASFVLATQSLDKLDDLSRTLRSTLLANVGCLAVFQVAGSDARQLVWELDRERVSEEDVVSLPVHHAYVRATVGTERAPAFSMEVRKPDDGNPQTAARIREKASAYLLTEEEIAAQRAEGRRRVERWLEQMADEDRTESEPEQRDQSRDGASGDGSRGKGPRSKRTRPPGASSGDDAA